MADSTRIAGTLSGVALNNNTRPGSAPLLTMTPSGGLQWVNPSKSSDATTGAKVKKIGSSSSTVKINKPRKRDDNGSPFTPLSPPRVISGSKRTAATAVPTVAQTTFKMSRVTSPPTSRRDKTNSSRSPTERPVLVEGKNTDAQPPGSDKERRQKVRNSPPAQTKSPPVEAPLPSVPTNSGPPRRRGAPTTFLAADVVLGNSEPPRGEQQPGGSGSDLTTPPTVPYGGEGGGGYPREPPRPTAHRPCVALSVNYIRNLEAIQQLRIVESRRTGPNASYNHGYDEIDGHYAVVQSEEIAERYVVKSFLGRGNFGTVVECLDKKYNVPVAVKIARRGGVFEQQANSEIEVLQALQPNQVLSSLITRLVKYFTWQGHIVLVFEKLACDLYEGLLVPTQHRGVSLGLVQKFCFQLCIALHEMGRHDPPIIHCDLKPENIMLFHRHKSALRVIDFGCACYETHRKYKYIQSRFYRAPEVILELPYTTAIDRWSLACVLVELHTGVPLFNGKSSEQQLHRMNSVLGPLPQDMIEQSPKRDTYFEKKVRKVRTVKESLDARGSVLSPPATVGADEGQSGVTLLQETKDVEEYHEVQEYTLKNTHVPSNAVQLPPLSVILGVVAEGPNTPVATAFLSLITGLLHYRPSERLSTSTALNHPFLAPLRTGPSGTTRQPPAAVVPQSNPPAPTAGGGSKQQAA